MKRILVTTLAVTSLGLVFCTASVEEACLSGPCGPDAQPSVETGSGASGDGGITCDPNATPATGDFPNDISAILQERCRPCHTDPPKNGAPFPLNTWEQTQVLYPQGSSSAKKIFLRMYAAVSSGLMPYLNAPDPTPDQKATLLEWLRTCAPPVPEGTGTDIGE